MLNEEGIKRNLKESRACWSPESIQVQRNYHKPESIKTNDGGKSLACQQIWVCSLESFSKLQKTINGFDSLEVDSHNLGMQIYPPDLYANQLSSLNIKFLICEGVGLEYISWLK